MVPEVEEIHVAQGTYKPASPGGDRNATFQLVAGVNLKGGYAGFGESDPDARNIRTYETILSGDLNGNDGPNFTNRGDNSAHVVKGCSGAVLDGFTITGGDSAEGAGIDNAGRSTTIINCKITDNRAPYGGGLYNYGGSPTLINCLFIGNEAKPNTIGDGGGMYSSDDGSGSSPALINCTFVGNSANDKGGGLCNYSTDMTITNCIFWGNSDGGGTDQSAQIHGSNMAINYCCIQGWTGTLGGEGNIGDDPLFADANGGDYHLKSERGRYRPSTDEWILDDVTSPGVDGGDPDVEPTNERMPNGGRINMGAYGNTAYASMSEWAIQGDENRDGIFNFVDLAIVLEDWLESEPWY